jgi:hypothetical protein
MRCAHVFHLAARTRSRLAAVIVAAALVATSLGGTATATRSSAPGHDPAVITFWNEVAVATIVTDAGKANAEAFLWFAFEQAAVYNAVVGITGRYEPYRWDPDRPHDASPQAGAASAAYQVLLNYFPASKGRLDTAYAESLAMIPDGAPKKNGISFGKRAAARIIKVRMSDGRGADVPYTKQPRPGVWRPTPPAHLPFFDPWLAKMRPLILDSNKQFRPGGPPSMSSHRYTTDFNEVKEFGRLTGSPRTPKQTETALFFSDIGQGPLQASLRDLVTRHQMDISESARLFAAVDTSFADGIGAVWDSKLHFAFWRPITAIQRAKFDGNPATEQEHGWLPFLTTPPYPEYPSGLTSVIGSASRSLARVLGTNRIDLYITSAAAGVTRHYEFAGKLNRDAINARVWSGIHFRTADEVGNALGKMVGDWALDHYFQPLR